MIVVSFLPLICSIVMAVASLLLYRRFKKSGILVIAIGYAINVLAGIANLVIFGLLMNLVFDDTSMLPWVTVTFSYIALVGLMIAAAGFVLTMAKSSICWKTRTVMLSISP